MDNTITMTAHKFIETEAIFEDIDNVSVEVVPINSAHEAVRIAKNEAYQEVLTLLKERFSPEQLTDEEEIMETKIQMIVHKLIELLKHKIK